MRDFPRKDCVRRKLALQSGQQLQRLGFVLLTHICNRQQDPRKGSEIVSMFGGGLQVGDSALLVGGQAADAKDPAHRGRHAPDDAFAGTRRQQGVVAIGTNREQLLR